MKKSPIFKTLFRRTIPFYFYSVLQFHSRKADSSVKFRSILFLRPGKLGDMVVATPLFHAVRKEFPHIKIAVACSIYNQVIVSESPDIDVIKPVQFHSLFKVVELIRWIRKSRFDWVVDLTPGISRTSTMISIFCRTRNTFTAGLQKERFAAFFDIDVDPGKLHIIEMYRGYLEEVLKHKFHTDFRPKVYIPARSETKAQQLFASSGQLIGVNLSAGVPCRQWNRENYDKLFSLMSKEFDCSGIIVFAVSHREWAEDFGRKHGIRIAPSADIMTISAMIKRLRFFFTPDTSLVHIASAFNVPVVALYHEEYGNVERWKGYRIPSRELASENVNDISPESVLSAIKEMTLLPEGKKI